jgi:hypothetical protein
VRTFAPLSIVATVIAYGIAGLIALASVSRDEALREQYPYESMEERLPKQSSEEDALAPNESAHFQIIELEGKLNERRNSFRERSLKQLHEQRVELFVRSPGFGMARLIGPEWGLRVRPRMETPDQPRLPAASGMPAERSISATDEPDLLKLNQEGIVNFAYPEGFGFVKDRQHVAGFLPHGFAEVPNSAKQWDVVRVELIGVLLHPKPIAYVSEKLPAMAELRGAPTRALDEFEVGALQSLKSGETIAVSMLNGQPRMLGAIRSARQCVECHGGKRGDLLGAFTYTLRPVVEKP